MPDNGNCVLAGPAGPGTRVGPGWDPGVGPTIFAILKSQRPEKVPGPAGPTFFY